MLLCDGLEGWEGGRETEKGGCVCVCVCVCVCIIYILIVDSWGVQQKLIQHCKAIILQLNFFNFKHFFFGLFF